MTSSPEVELELAARRLEGETLAHVSYLDPWPGVERGEVGAHDTVGLAVYLELASGRRVEVRWADELGLRHGFGIALRDVAVVDSDRGHAGDASARWRDRIGARITSSAIRWRAIEDDLRSTFRFTVAVHADHIARADYPHALDLRFGDRRGVSIEVPFVNALTVVFT